MSESPIPAADVAAPVAAKPKRRFVGSSTRPSRGKSVPARRVNQIPDEILNDKALNEAISGKSYLDPYDDVSVLMSTQTLRFAFQLFFRNSQDNLRLETR